MYVHITIQNADGVFCFFNIYSRNLIVPIPYHYFRSFDLMTRNHQIIVIRLSLSASMSAFDWISWSRVQVRNIGTIGSDTVGRIPKDKGVGLSVSDVLGDELEL